MRRRLAIVAAVLCCAGPAAAQDDARGEPEVEDIRFEGAHALDRSVLYDAIETRASGCRSPLFVLACIIGDFDWAEARRLLTDTAAVYVDAQRLETVYHLWGYPDARVVSVIEPQPDGDVIVRFVVSEGEPLRVASLDIRGVELDGPLPLEVGDPYAMPRLEALIEIIEMRFAEQGHPYAVVEVSGDVDPSTRRANVVLEAVPGPAVVFGSVTVAAESPISEGVVHERLAIRPGEPFRTSSIQRTERSLYELPIVERVATELTGLATGEAVIDVHVNVSARRPAGVEVEGTVSSTDCLEMAAFWRHRYVGGPRVLSIGGGVGNLLAEQASGSFPCTSTGTGAFAEPNHRVEAELREYGFAGDERTTLVLRGFWRRESSPNAYVSRGKGGAVELSRELGRGWWVVAGWRAEHQELAAANAYFCGNYGVCADSAIDALSGAQWLAPAELIVAWQSTELPGGLRRPDTGPGTEWRTDVVPDWRWSARAGVEAAAGVTGSAFSFTRAIGEASVTRVLGRSLEVAARFRGAALGGDAILPPQMRLFSGGVSTVRGVEENLLGPKVLIAREGAAVDTAFVDPADVSVRATGGDRLVEANVEARLWVSDVLQLAGFIDYGRIWRVDEGALPFDGLDAASRVTPGVGFRLVTDLGPIRVDVGYDPGGFERLPLLLVDDEGSIRSAGLARFSPYEYDDPSAFRAFVRRLQLHVAIGQAF